MNYEDLKITLDLGSPACLTDSLGFDALLSYAVYCETGLQGADTLEHIPLDKKHGLFCGSNLFVAKSYSHQQMSRVMSLKKEGDMQPYHFRPQPKRKVAQSVYSYIDLQRNEYKANLDSYSAICTPYVYFYARGDASRIHALLELVPGIGKRASTGAGQIMGIHVEGTDEDYSFCLASGKPARDIPVDVWKQISGKEASAGLRSVGLPRYEHAAQLCVYPSSILE